MGYMRAAEMRKFVGEDAALRDHLAHNHYPPVPLAMIGPCKRAIAAAREGEWDRQIRLPKGVSYRDQKTASVRAIVEAHHLEAFLGGFEDLEEYTRRRE